MLQIKGISKQYRTGELVQQALNDVSLNGIKGREVDGHGNAETDAGECAPEAQLLATGQWLRQHEG